MNEPRSKFSPSHQRCFCALVSLACCAAFLPIPAAAQSKAVVEKTLEKSPEIVQKLFDCRTIAAGAERLACYDREVAAVEVATTQKDLVIADKKQIAETRRGLFGLNLSGLNIFAGDGQSEADQQIEGVVTSASQVSGKWYVVLEDGAKWIQTDTQGLALYPKKGSKIQIRRAAMGSYLANIDGQRALRMKRVN